jgi:excinuclease ABC subunit C
MAAVVRRRFGEENSRSWPDLLLLDGGRPQLRAVSRVLEEMDIAVPLLAIAKGRDQGGSRDRGVPDCFYQPGRKDALPLLPGAPAYRLLQQVRDEAHRFALNYHRLLRKKGRQTLLLEIDGVGEQRAQRLLKAFGSVEAIARHSPEELAGSSSVSLPLAAKIISFLNLYLN